MFNYSTFISRSKLFGLGLIFISLLLSFCNSTDQSISFNRDVRPILNAHCMSCHGGVKQQGNISFLFEKDYFQPGASGKPPIIKGKPRQSLLYQRITHENPELRMPLDAEPLTVKQQQILYKWIQQGAEWEEHWAFIPPQTAQLTADNNWSQQPIDRFVYQTMEDYHLTPSPEASEEILLRRIYLDLIGIPPTLEAVDRYLSDPSPNKYEQEVEILLKSVHYGEKWSSFWLDLARYADSQGFQKDKLRTTMWMYRDWVIKALNDDMPFDQFTIEQLAGDLIPNNTDQQLLATAFHRNTMTNDEGGTDDEEYRVQAVLDRTNTTMEIWQGITFSCVQCHSHPFDPIEHREYYEMMSYFNNTQDYDHYSEFPKASLLSEAQKEIRDSINLLDEPPKKLLASMSEALIPVMREMPADSSRSTHLFERGNWLVHGEKVSPDVPNAINKTNKIYTPNRLGLAEWLVDESNPLTARVFVNRIWHQLFGRGLVETLEDFGTQGSSPSHPELLDYLAIQFMDVHHWSIKSLIKEIVLSNTYRQSSHRDPVKLNLDPENIYLSQGPRVRLTAEQIRDQALAVSDLLNNQAYGPSVMPYQPEGVWNVIRHVAQWKTSDHQQQYRRALYTFWRRVSPYPAMLLFDSPSRELCVSRRINTNTPLQALNLLNDSVYLEAAFALADLAIQNQDSPSDQIQYAYRKATCNHINQQTLEILMEQYHQVEELYQKNADELQKLIPEGANQSSTRAALYNVCQTILNLDEMIMKR